MSNVYVHIGPAPAAMRARELAQPAAVVEILRPDRPLPAGLLLAEAHTAAERDAAWAALASLPLPVTLAVAR